jgi:hypothetical protein
MHIPPTLYPTGKTSLSNRLGDHTRRFLADPTTASDRSIYDEALAWAREVFDTAYSDLDSIHGYMVDSTVPGALTLCSKAFYSKWANARGSGKDTVGRGCW